MHRIIFIVSILIVSLSTMAANRHPVRKSVSRSKPVAAKKIVPAKATPVESRYRKDPYVGALAMDAQSGRILFSDGADQPARMASVTKLMTALLVLEDVAAGKYTLQSEVSASPLAEMQEASIIGFRDLKTKRPITRSVDTLLYALMIRSANDAAVALAEHADGSFERFVDRMNARATQLGMSATRYYNPNGLPPKSGKRYPWKEYNVTSCNDQAKLAREILLKHPEILKYTSRKTWTMPDGMVITNHNNVMRTDKLKIINPDGTEAIDGLKTGYIDAGGSSIVLSGSRNGLRAIVVVLGSGNAKLRDEKARSLMADALSAL